MVSNSTQAVAADSAELKQVIEGAKREGALNLMWSQATLGGSTGAERIQDALNQRYGTDIKIRFAPVRGFARIGKQLSTELATGQTASADIYLATAAQIAPLIKKNMFASVPWTKLLPGRITPEIVEMDNRVLRLATGLTGATYNTKIAPMTPTKLEDFLRPEWKGKLASTPYGAGFDVLAANDVWGREKTLSFVRNLAGQISGLIGCAQTERLTSGEYAALVMNCTGQFGLIFKAKGAPVDRMIPRDAGALRYYYLTVVKHAENPNAAKLFTTFLLSEAGQKIQWDLAKLDLHSLPGSQSGAAVDHLRGEGVNFREVTVSWWAAHPEITKTKREIIKILKSKGKR